MIELVPTCTPSCIATPLRFSVFDIDNSEAISVYETMSNVWGFGTLAVHACQIWKRWHYVYVRAGLSES
jgi:hypothetical protein